MNGISVLLYGIILYPILYMLPAYVANGAPVLFKGKKPLDFNKKINGNRILGKNKTIKGTVASLCAGIIMSVIISLIPSYSYMLVIGIVLTIGANIGDLLGSFAKRMLSIAPGRSVPLLDQYDFFVVALLFALPFGHMPSIYGILFIVVLTGILHLLTNMGAYKLKLKDVPW